MWDTRQSEGIFPDFCWSVSVLFWTTLQIIKRKWKSSRSCSEFSLNHVNIIPHAHWQSLSSCTYLYLFLLPTSLLSGHISLFIPICFIFISFYSHLLYVYFHLPFLVNSLALPVIAKLRFLWSFHIKKEYAFFFENILDLNPTYTERGWYTILSYFYCLV